MALPVIEISIFTPSDAYRADINILNAGFVQLAKVDGLQRTFHGLQVDDPHTGYVLNVWDSLGHHHRLMQRGSYNSLIATMEPAFVGPVRTLHVRFTSNPLPALTEPVTEITFLTLGSLQHKHRVLEMLNKTSTSRNGEAVSCGEVVEQENLIVVVRGWSTNCDSTTAAQKHDAESAVSLSEAKRVRLTEYSQ